MGRAKEKTTSLNTCKGLVATRHPTFPVAYGVKEAVMFTPTKKQGMACLLSLVSVLERRVIIIGERRKDPVQGRSTLSPLHFHVLSSR